MLIRKIQLLTIMNLLVFFFYNIFLQEYKLLMSMYFLFINSWKFRPLLPPPQKKEKGHNNLELQFCNCCNGHCCQSLFLFESTICNPKILCTTNICIEKFSNITIFMVDIKLKVVNIIGYKCNNRPCKTTNNGKTSQEFRVSKMSFLEQGTLLKPELNFVATSRMGKK